MWVDDALAATADGLDLTEARIAVAMSDEVGAPGLHAVRTWEPDALIEALVLTAAFGGMARYNERRRIAEGSL